MGACVHGRARCVTACGGKGSGGAARCAHRNGLRALLRDGSRQPLGADRPRSRSDRVRRGHACRGSRRGGSRELRAGSDRRVRRAGRARGASAPRSRGRRDLLQLPSRSGAAAVGAPARSGNRSDDDDALPRGLPVPGRLRRAGSQKHARRGSGRQRPAPAPRRRDREVRPRDVLLQRRRGERVAGRAPDPRTLAARRPELRPEARDVCGRASLVDSATRSATGTRSPS